MYFLVYEVKKRLYYLYIRDETRHGKAFEGLLNRYFGK